MRKPGDYFVLYGEWMVAHWNGVDWKFARIGQRYEDERFTEIDETPIDRDKIRAVVEAADITLGVLALLEVASTDPDARAVAEAARLGLETALAAYHGTVEEQG